MHKAATDGMEASPGVGRIAFAHRAATLPGVSEPSRVVRSMQRMARSSAHSLEVFLIERLASEAARSSAPTWSTLRTPRINEPRWVNDSAVATFRLCGALDRALPPCRGAARPGSRLRTDASPETRGHAFPPEPVGQRWLDFRHIRGWGDGNQLRAVGQRVRSGLP